ncbi:hypothetical protein [Dokdonella soli]|uniref:Uncharacterized protein n=1 Tax=Dokdonella soli TaxID=529810 RepID=A0ABN1IUB8_9GAMM
MTAVLRKLESGTRMMIHPCNVCGSDRAPFGYTVKGHPSRWYCWEHREVGEAYLRGAA